MKKLAKILIIILIFIAVFLAGVRLYFRLPVRDYYSASEKGFVIPGTSDGFISQGIDHVKDRDVFLVTGYMKDGSTSPIYIVDNSKKTPVRVLMRDSNGNDYFGHCGGIAVHNDLVFVAGSDEHCLHVFSLDEILSSGDGDFVTSLDTVPVPGDTSVAFVTAADDELYVGEFYKDPQYPTVDSHKITTSAGDYNQAIMLAYRFSDSSDAVLGVDPVPVRAYSITDLTQGMAERDGKIYLSTSWGASFSNIYVYDTGKANISSYSTEGTGIPLYELDSSCLEYSMKIPPMSEEIVFVDDKMYTMCESASNKYIFGKFTSAKWCYATKMQ